jgi:hypothetical protein
MDEQSVLRRVWLGMQGISTLFRVQTGKGWVSGGGKAQRLPSGHVLVPNGRPVALGFGLVSGDPVEGTSDLVGLTKVTITPEMVGHVLPVFTVFETKRLIGGRISPAQHNFIDVITGAGGIGAAVNSPESAMEAYTRFMKRFESKI